MKKNEAFWDAVFKDAAAPINPEGARRFVKDMMKGMPPLPRGWKKKFEWAWSSDSGMHKLYESGDGSRVRLTDSDGKILYETPK